MPTSAFSPLSSDKIKRYKKLKNNSLNVHAVDKAGNINSKQVSDIDDVLLSTILPPFFLRFTISYYNKKAEEHVCQLANEEMELHGIVFDMLMTRPLKSLMNLAPSGALAFHNYRAWQPLCFP